MSASPGELTQILENLRLVDYETLKGILKVFILFLAGLNVILFIGTILHRVYVDIRDLRYRKAYEGFEREFEGYTLGRSGLSRPKSSTEFEALADLFVYLIRRDGADITDCVRRIAGEVGLIDYLWKQTRSLFLNTRVTAFERLGYLRVEEAEPVIREDLIRERNEWVLGRLCFAYSFLVRDKEELSFLIGILSSLKEISFKFIELIWTNILDNFRADRRKILRDHVVENLIGSQERSQVLRSFVEAVGFAGETEFIPIIREIYERTKKNTLMRISCLRALGMLGYKDYCELFLENVDHPDWRVRAVVCKYANLCPFQTIKGPLVQRLSDENYYVRVNAGKALASFGKMAQEVLGDILNSEDKFARDTARYLLEELEIKHA